MAPHTQDKHRVSAGEAPFSPCAPSLPRTERSLRRWVQGNPPEQPYGCSVQKTAPSSAEATVCPSVEPGRSVARWFAG